MNFWMICAGIVSIATMFAHIFGGGPEIHDPILLSDLNEPVKAVLSVIWHEITILLAVNGIALLWVSKKEHFQVPVLLIISVQYLAFAGLFIFYGLVRLDSLLLMPQWSVFIFIPVLAGIGLRKASDPPKSPKQRLI